MNVAAELAPVVAVVVEVQPDRAILIGRPERDQVGGLPDAFGPGPHVPRFQVERDPEILPDHHAIGDDLHLAAPIGEQLRHRRGLMKPQLVDHHDPAGR